MTEQAEIEYGYGALDDIRALFEEYTESLHVDLQFQHYDQELKDLPGHYAMPYGRLYLARVNGRAAGCAAFRQLDADSCEFKRLYVRPEFRGMDLGRRLMETAIADARSCGYCHGYLDTLERLHPAVALYEKLGFRRIPAYYENPLPGVCYFRIDLKKA